MIQEAYVSFETAKLLKEKGFPQDDTRILNTCYKYNGKFCNNVKSMSHVDREICYMTPTQQMAMDWLREEHSIYITAEPDTNDKHCFYPSLYTMTEETWEKQTFEELEDLSFKSPEKTIEATLLFSLKNLI